MLILITLCVVLSGAIIMVTVRQIKADNATQHEATNSQPTEMGVECGCILVGVIVKAINESLNS
jgi:hypothetical protein